MPEESFGQDNEAYIKIREAALDRHDFATNDIVVIAGRGAARVNSRHVRLSAHAFVILVLLVEFAIKCPGKYITTEGLIIAIKSANRRLGTLGMSWVEPLPSGVHRAIYQLRAALTRAGLDNESLIELTRAQGYRLNTPAINLVIDPAMRLSDGQEEDGGTDGGKRHENKPLHGEVGLIYEPQA
jgi:DNA-binding winged helix-turn-helix (wHTH) protein